MLTATDPSTGKRLHEVPAATSAQVEDILSRAETAFKSWRTRSFNERAEVLLKVARLMRDDVDRLAILMTEEMGKPIKEARGEVDKSAWCAEHYAEHAQSYLATQLLPSDATTTQ